MNKRTVLPRLLGILLPTALILGALACNLSTQLAGSGVTNPPSTLEPTPIPAMPLLFVSERDGNPEIYSLSLGDSQIKRLTDAPSKDIFPALSPDGQRIVFVSDRDGNNEIYSMKIDGTEVVRLTSTPDDEWFPRWSPDGRQIVSVLGVEKAGDLYIMNADGSQPKNVTNSTRSEWSAVWSPDGTQLAFDAWDDEAGMQIFRMQADGTGEQQLTSEKGYAWAPAWSPDGASLLFVSIPTPPDGMNGMFITEQGRPYATAGAVLDLGITPVQPTIYRMNADGSNVAALAGVPANSWAPALSTDGQTLFFVSDSAGNLDIYSLLLSGGTPFNLTDNAALDYAPAQPFIPIVAPLSFLIWNC